VHLLLTHSVVNRLQFIQENLPEELTLLPIETILEFVREYVARNQDELDEMQATRRHGKTPSARELNMRQQMENETREFESGYWIPDLTNEANLHRLKDWNGEWVGLNAVSFVRVTKAGDTRPSSFPPRGNS
jgi:translation machinery-associated protein 16